MLGRLYNFLLGCIFHHIFRRYVSSIEGSSSFPINHAAHKYFLVTKGKTLPAKLTPQSIQKARRGVQPQPALFGDVNSEFVLFLFDDSLDLKLPFFWRVVLSTLTS